MSDDLTFLFEDFFASDEERTVDIPVTILGRVVPITVKVGLTVEDRLAAQRAAIKKSVKPSGEVTILGVDESEATIELLARAIVRWPFMQKDGVPVPVTRENIRKLLGGADALAAAIQKLDAEGLAALDPFVTPSAED